MLKGIIKGKNRLNYLLNFNANPRYTARGRFDAMRDKMNKNLNKYPDMSSSLIDYSDPSDLPEIFTYAGTAWLFSLIVQH